MGRLGIAAIDLTTDLRNLAKAGPISTNADSHYTAATQQYLGRRLAEILDDAMRRSDPQPLPPDHSPAEPPPRAPSAFP